MAMELEEYLERVRVVAEDAEDLADDLSAGLKKKVTGEALNALLKKGKTKITDYHALLSLLSGNRLEEAKKTCAYPIGRVENNLNKLEEWTKSNGAC